MCSFIQSIVSFLSFTSIHETCIPSVVPDPPHSLSMRKTAIAKELIWNEHESITDVAALEDAKKSLSRMLEASLDFLMSSVVDPT